MTIRLVVFDLDGTLIDSSRDLARAVNTTLDRIAPGTPPLPLRLVQSFIGNGARNLILRSLAETHVALPVQDVLPIFLETYSACLLDTTRLYPGVAEALDAMADRQLAVLTNKPGDMSRRILEGLGVGTRFRWVLGGDDLPSRKPDPAGLRLLMDGAEAGPGETVLVGDSAIDVRTGRAAGVLTMGVDYGFDAESLAADPPDRMLSDLRALPPLLASL